MGVRIDVVMVHGAGDVGCSVIGLVPVLFLCTEMLNGPRVTPTISLKKFSWGYLKAKSCTPPPVNLNKIRRRITREMDELIISRDKVKIRRAVRDMWTIELGNFDFKFLLSNIFPLFSHQMDETAVKLTKKST